VVTFTSPPLPEEFKSSIGLELARKMTVQDKGILYGYTYTMLELKVVTLANNYTDIIVMLRDPSGKTKKGRQWLGDWHEDCDLWTKHTKQQIGDVSSLESEATFWMSLGDLIEIFDSVTVNFLNF
jgi:hypothetical protein